MRTVVLLFCLLLAYSTGAKNITFDDLYSIPRCQDPQISPDSKQIAFTMRTTDPAKNSSRYHIWMMNSDGSGQKQFTYGENNDHQPRWTLDGKYILFISNRSGSNQIWKIAVNGGEADQVTNIASGVSEFEITPTGMEVIIVSETYPDCIDDSCYKAKTEAIKNSPTKARLYDKLLYRHYNCWDDGTVCRLFMADLATGQHHPLFINEHSVPTNKLGGYRDYDISPDGADICFAMSVDSVPAIGVNNDLYLISSEGGQPYKLTDNPGLDISPRYSPDGRYILYHSTARFGYESDQKDLILLNTEKIKSANLTKEFDLSVGSFVWDPNSKFVYFMAIEHGLNKIWQLDISSKKIELILGNAVFSNLSISPNGKYLILSVSTSERPYELYKYDLRKNKLIRLTNFTDDIVKDLEMKRGQSFWFEGAMGDSVHGFITLPPGFDQDNVYPMVLLIHGGPQWCWLGDFNYYGWNTQLVAAQNYVVVQIDPHGSVGYGLKFKEYVSGNWGRGDYEDLMKGIDFMIENYSFIDSTRIAALGRSYGGFMTNWICGHTDRFSCLVTVDGTANQISEYGSTEELWFPEWECKGTPWNNYEEYYRSSPIMYAKNFKTPTMVVHGQLDYRVDLSEGMQMFTALQRMGVPSQFLYYPDDGHNARKIENLRLTYEEIFKWLDKWLNIEK